MWSDNEKESSSEAVWVLLVVLVVGARGGGLEGGLDCIADTHAVLLVVPQDDLCKDLETDLFLCGTRPNCTCGLQALRQKHSPHVRMHTNDHETCNHGNVITL